MILMNQFVMLIIHLSFLYLLGDVIVINGKFFVFFPVHQQSLAIFEMQRLVATLLHEEKTMISLILVVRETTMIGMYA